MIRRDGAVAHLVLDRPRERNPLDWETVRALLQQVKALDADEGVRVVLVYGNGGTFSAGGDLKGYVDLYRRPADFRRFLGDFHELLDRMEQSPKIYCAVVTGYCVAGGLELLLACDVAIAAKSARIGDAHLNFGQLPGAGGSQRLPRVVGPLRAKHLMLSGGIMAADEALAMGLVSAVSADEELWAAVAALTGRILSESPVGVRGVKHLVNQGMRMDLTDALRMELEFVHNYATTCPDATEGLMAFQEKRKPRFSGP
jgi:enoyl-CoA hydratase/carnithine racemase